MAQAVQQVMTEFILLTGTVARAYDFDGNRRKQ